METDDILKVCECSEHERGVYYTKFLGDGGSSSYPTIRFAKPYGDENSDRVGCIGHIQNRVGFRLRHCRKM